MRRSFNKSSRRPKNRAKRSKGRTKYYLVSRGGIRL